MGEYRVSIHMTNFGVPYKISSLQRQYASRSFE